MTRRALLGALCCSVVLGAAGIGSAVALQDRQPALAGGAYPAHAQGHGSALDRDPTVGPPPEARTTATVPPVVPAPRAATTVAPPAPTVPPSQRPAPAVVSPSTTVRGPSSTSPPSTTTTTRDPLDPVAPPILVPIEGGGTYPIPVANVLGCAVSPSSIDVAYGEHVTVQVTYATGYHPGTAVMMSNEWDRFYSSTDATGRGADFQVVIHEPYPDGNGGTEPAGTPHLLYPNHRSGGRMNCSLRVTPHLPTK